MMFLYLFIGYYLISVINILYYILNKRTFYIDDKLSRIKSTNLIFIYILQTDSVARINILKWLFIDLKLRDFKGVNILEIEKL